MNFAKRFSYDMHEVTSTESALKRLSTLFEKDSDLKFLSGASVRSFLETHCAVLVSAFKARPCHLLARKTSLSLVSGNTAEPFFACFKADRNRLFISFFLFSAFRIRIFVVFRT
ncbi:hypothetical protein CEXT_101041 [Caerostris extrusa]|uniref:Uncharacterized protein n=1 Tax=Caerostris extrusa TaxID=172846 RepID=A0AAV4XE81_CAEEX|nr:hypothetical protein CEXT_101041 [Caerostris extrusa]